LQYRFDIDAGRIGRGAHHGLRFANGEGIIDRESQADVMNGIAGLEFAAEPVVLCEGLCVKEPRLDLPKSVVAEVAGAFDRSAVHQATPAAVALVDIGHFSCPCSRNPPWRNLLQPDILDGIVPFDHDASQLSPWLARWRRMCRQARRSSTPNN
jgi:hypothetical protein